MININIAYAIQNPTLHENFNKSGFGPYFDTINNGSSYSTINYGIKIIVYSCGFNLKALFVTFQTYQIKVDIFLKKRQHALDTVVNILK